MLEKSRNKKKEKENDEFTEYQRLKQRYQDRPFHERNFAWYWLAIVGFWLSNIVSGLTESAKLFALFFGIFGSISCGFEVSIFFMCLGMGIIELTHRTFARTYFKEYVVEGGHTREQNGNLFGMIACLVLSVVLSIGGQFDGLRILINPPAVAATEQMDVDKVNMVISPIVKDAKNRVDNYYHRRKYKGRIAQEDKHKYREYEDHAKAMEDSLMSAIMRIPGQNSKAKKEIQKQYEKDLSLYEKRIQSKGIGLLVVTLPAILILYLSLWFEEKYMKKKADYLVDKFETGTEDNLNQASVLSPLPTEKMNLPRLHPQQQPLEQLSHLDSVIEHPETENGLEGSEMLSKMPIGYYTEAQKRANDLLQYVATRNTKDFSNEKGDRYTILHFNFKTGKPIRYPKERVNWYVKSYAQKVEEAVKKNLDEEVVVNRKSKLLYWESRQKELFKKME